MSWQNDPVAPAGSAPWGNDPVVAPSPRDVLGVAAKVNPDQAAEAERLAKRYPAPSDVLLRNLQDVKLQAAVDDADAKLNTNVPALRARMTDVPFAQQAHDDVGALAAIEGFVRQTGRSAKSGVFGASRGAAGVFQAGAEFVAPALDFLEVDPFKDTNDWRAAIGGNPLRRLAEGFASIGQQNLGVQKGLRPQGEQGNISAGFFSGVESLTQNLLALPMAFAPGGQTAALSMMTANTGGQSYQDAREKGLGMSQALPYAASQAAIEYATEKLPLTRLLGDVKAGTPFMQTLARQIALEVPGEQVATILQDLNEWAVLNPDKPFTSYLEERPSAAAQTLVATIVGSGGSVTVAKGLERIATLAAERDAQIAKSDTDLQNFERLLGVAAESKLRERAPETFAQFVQEAATDAGAPTAVYLDARALTDALNAAGITDEQLAQIMPSVPAQMADAFEAGGVVEIPVGEALAAAPGTPLEQVLLQNARLEPDGLSRVEVDEAAKQAAEYVKTEAERVMQQAEQRAAAEQEAGQIKTQIAEQLNAAGRFRPEVNDAYATMVGAFYATTAQRLGVTPSELYARYPLRVTGEMQTNGALEQGAQYPMAPEGQWYGEGTYKVNGGRLVSVTPDEYIAAVRPLALDEESRENIDLLKEHIRAGKTLDPLLIRADGKEDGRHRAYAAKELGIQRVPVIAYGDQFKDAPGYTDTLTQQTRATFSPVQSAPTQTDTPEFKAWFGDSKVVDAEGKPLVAYHGTQRDWGDSATFQGNVQFFSESLTYAEAWANIKIHQEDGTEAFPQGKTVMPVYLSVRNPANLDAMPGIDPQFDLYKKGVVNKLKKAGHDGAYWTEPGGFKNWITFAPTQIKSAIGNRGTFDPNNPSILEQQTRATFSPSQLLIALGPNADYSSFLHETGHFWLEVLSDIASQPNAPQQVVDDMNRVLEWFGVTPEAWDTMTLDQKRPYHERWAESTEQYFFEGRAPSVELRGVFDRFRTWLLTVYKSLKQFLASRSVTPGGRAAVGPGELAQSAPAERDLMVTHNLTGANLLHAVKMGGLPVPSLAITKKDTPLTGFGEITLIGDSNLADPKGYAGTKVYGADIYSPRYPSVERELDNKAVAALTKRVKPMVEKMGDSLPGTSELQRDGQRELERNIAVMGTFLQEQGVEPNIVMRTGLDDARRARLEQFGLGPFMDATSVYDLLDNEAFRAAALAETRDAYAKAGKREWLVKSLDTDEQFQRNVVRSVAQEIVNDAKLRARPEADRYATQQAMEKQIAEGDLVATYQQWVQDELAKVTKSERIFQGFTNSGNRKYIPHTLENVVKLLKKELRGGESFNYGVGSLRAKFTPEFKSLAAIKKEKGRLVSADEFEAVKKEVDAEFNAVMAAIDPSLSSDTAIGILEDAAKMGVPKAAKAYGYDISDEAAQKAAQFLTRLRNLPTAYFEAKVLRDVSLSEFKAAVVPEGTDQKVLDALKAAGITDVRTYAKGDEVARGEAIKQFDELFFQRDTAQAGPLGLTDEVRQVMDRLLATDEQIAEMERVRQYGLLFKSPEEAGMTPEQWAAYTSDDERAHAEALTELGKRSLKDLGIVMRKRMRALKDIQKDMAGKRKVVEAEAAAQIAAEPVYRAMRWLKKGEMTTPEGEDIKATDGFKLDRASVEAIFPESMPGRPDLTKLRGMMLKEGGLSPDIVAEMFGFRDGAHLVTSIVEAFPQQDQVDGLTDQMMLERYGDMTTLRGQERAADEAVHNENRARVLAAEMVAINAANNARAPGQGGRTVNAMVQAAKQFAERLVESKKVKDLKPQQHTAAETRAARAAEKALAKGDTQGVITAKRDQLLNFHAAKATNEARNEALKIQAFFKKVATAKDDTVGKTRDLDVVKAAQAILSAYGMTTEAKGKSAAEYLRVLEANDPAMYGVLRDSVDAATAAAKPLPELTMAELRALHEEVQAMWFLAKRSRQMEVDGNLLDLQEVEDALKARMQDIGIPGTMPGDTSAITKSEERLLKFKSFLAAARRVESWVGAMDGKDQTIGVFRRYIWQPVKEAADRYRTDKGAYLKRYEELLRPLAGSLRKRQIAAPELGYVFGKDTDGVAMSEILHAILHTGNESNKRKLLLGRRWATENPDGTLDTSRWDAFIQRLVAEGTLTSAHFDFAQGVWDMLEDMKPLAQKTHRAVFGKYFAEVTANEFTDPFGVKRRGGYIPATADARIVSDQATKRLAEDENASLQFAFPATPKGFTKSRVDYNAPLLLDLRSLSQHIDKVLKFSHMEQHVRDVRKALTAKGVAYGLNRIDPVAFDAVLTPWLRRAAMQQVETPILGDRGLLRFFSVLRNRAGMAAMFANVANAAQQLTGFSIAAVKLKRPSLMVSALAEFAKAPRQMQRTVADASPYMASRMENEVAMMSDAINAILLDPNVYEKGQRWFQKHAYFLQSAVDNITGPIIWTAAYNDALERGNSDQDAKRFADSVIRETQGSTLAEDVSRIETGNPFVRLFTQFMGYFNMQANLLGTEFQVLMRDMGLRAGAGRAMYVFLLGFYAPAVVAELIMQVFRGGPEDEERDGYLDDWLAQVFGLSAIRGATAMVPVAGPLATAAINATNNKPYDDRISTSPAISMLESSVRAPMSVYKAIAEDASQQKAVRESAVLLSLLTGIPVAALAKPVGYAAAVEQGRVSPTSPADAARGAITGVASPESKR